MIRFLCSIDGFRAGQTASLGHDLEQEYILKGAAVPVVVKITKPAKGIITKD